MGHPEEYAARLEAEADEIIARMSGLANGENVEQNNHKAGPSTDSPANDKNPAPDQTDSQDASEVGNDDADSDLDRKIRASEERIKNAQAKMHRATQEAAELRKINQQMADRLSQLEAKVQAEEEPELKSLQEDYPDIAKPLLAKISKLEKQLYETAQSFDAKAEVSQLEKHFQTIRSAHPDFEDLAGSEDFQGWLDRQTPVWKQVSKSGTADEVIELISRYKEVLTPSPSDKARRVAEPSVPRATKTNKNSESSKRLWTRDEINRLSLSEYAKLEEEIDRAMVEGRIR